MTNMGFVWRVCGVSLVGAVMFGQAGFGQTAKSKTASAVKPGMATWSPDVQQTLGVSADNFKAEGLDKLTKMQLVALMTSARLDPKKQVLTCPVSGMVPGGRIHVQVTVAGDDPTGGDWGRDPTGGGIGERRGSGGFGGAGGTRCCML